MNPIVALTVFLWLTNGNTAVVSQVVPPNITCDEAVKSTRAKLDADHVKLGVAAAMLDCEVRNPPHETGTINPDGSITPDKPAAPTKPAKPVDPAPHGVHQDDGSI